MKEELEKRLLDSLDKVAGFVEQTADLAAQEAPLVAQEIINLKMIDAFGTITGFVIGLIVALFFLKFSNHMKIKANEVEEKRDKYGNGQGDSNDYRVPMYILSFLAVFVLVISTLQLASGLEKIFEAYFTPRLLIIDEIKRMIRGF